MCCILFHIAEFQLHSPNLQKIKLKNKTKDFFCFCHKIIIIYSILNSIFQLQDIHILTVSSSKHGSSSSLCSYNAYHRVVLFLYRLWVMQQPIQSIVIIIINTDHHSWLLTYINTRWNLMVANISQAWQNDPINPKALTSMNLWR